MRIRVEVYADHDDLPLLRAIHFGSRRVEIAETLDQWHGPDYRYVKVRSCDGATYILKLDETHADWELTMFERAS
jgi:hypothetical protein